MPLTWITPKMMWAYAALHDAGLAHSYEVWNEGGELVAGNYGVAVGRVFVGESMFTGAPGAGAWLTTWVITGDCEPLKSASPE